MTQVLSPTAVTKAISGWPPLVALPLAALALYPADWPRWAIMWCLTFSIYACCKWLTWRRTPTTHAPVWKNFAYLFAWPGMDAATFLHPPTSPAEPPRRREWLFALSNTLAGPLLFFGVARLMPADYSLVRGWVGLVGLAFFFHFGIFHVLSCLWRSAGVHAVPLMDWPIASRSVAEFWGRRWNRAFRDLTNRFLFRPLAHRWGGTASLLVGFLVSGIIHDIVISLPAQGGYGRPTAYFLIQGLAILASHSTRGRALGLNRGIRGWLLAFAVVLLPVGLLFHPPFVDRIVVPFMQATGALP